MVRRRLVVILGVGATAIALAQSAGPVMQAGGGGSDVPDNLLTGYRGTGTLAFSDIGPSDFSETLTISIPGATVGSPVRCNATTNIAPLLVSQWVSSAGVVSLVLTNTNTFSNIDPPEIEFACLVVE